MISNADITTIFIDLGNTLRILTKDEEHMARARRRITELVETDEDPRAFCAKLDERYKAYRRWAFEQQVEAPEAELWTRWLAPEFPPERIAPLGVELTFQFRQSMGRRVVVEHGKEVVAELHRRGYVLGIISNVITSREIPDWLEADGFAPYFKAVVLSAVFGRRKPDPAIYREAARLAGAAPACCAYVGDNLKRDVTGARVAGFGMVVILLPPEALAEAAITDENRPDVIIHRFQQLLDIFPVGADRDPPWCCHASAWADAEQEVPARSAPQGGIPPARGDGDSRADAEQEVPARSAPQDGIPPARGDDESDPPLQGGIPPARVDDDSGR